MKKLLLFLTACWLCPSSLFAQLCTGSLGDPVVHITFGEGAGIGAALRPGTTTYNFASSACPNDGDYTIVDFSSNCFGNSWHTINEDHTPNDVNGRFMLVNASVDPGDFYVDTIRGLCASTNYEFAAWVKNVLRPSSCNNAGIRPNLTFRVESLTGTVLTMVNSGDIDALNTPEWRQFGAFFQTQPGVTEVVIRLTNNAPGGCGNDIALDDITFRPCGPTVNAQVISQTGGEIFVCERDNKTLELNAAFSPGIYANPAFQWQILDVATNSWQNIPGATSNSYLRPPTAVGLYQYRMLIADGPNINSVSCRLSSNIIRINIVHPQAQATDSVAACSGTSVTFNATGGNTYNWTGPNGFNSLFQAALLRDIQPNSGGWYTVRATDIYGCYDEDSTFLLVYPSVNAQVSAAVGICEGSSTTLSASGGIRYLWAPSQGLSNDTIANPVATPADSTLYTALVFNQFGCFDTASVQVNVWRKPLANAGSDLKTRSGRPVTLNGSVTGTEVNFYWTPTTGFLGSPAQLRPGVNPPQTTFYTLHAESLLGCGSHTDEMQVKVYDKILIPNVFSPNGDGINDTWVIEPLDIFTESVTTIFNRYGQTVYTSKGYPRPWDGTRNGNPLPFGTYYYVIDLKTPNEPVLTGSVTIIR